MNTSVRKKQPFGCNRLKPNKITKPVILRTETQIIIAIIREDRTKRAKKTKKKQQKQNFLVRVAKPFILL